jgi:FixJ family two-component response regulator
MNYAVDVAKIRTARDRAIQQARNDARAKLAELTDRRDAEIRRLAAEGLSTAAIGSELGCNQVTAWEVRNGRRADRRARQRRRYLRLHSGGRAA